MYHLDEGGRPVPTLYDNTSRYVIYMQDILYIIPNLPYSSDLKRQTARTTGTKPEPLTGLSRGTTDWAFKSCDVRGLSTKRNRERARRQTDFCIKKAVRRTAARIPSEHARLSIISGSGKIAQPDRAPKSKGRSELGGELRPERMIYVQNAPAMRACIVPSKYIRARLSASTIS